MELHDQKQTNRDIWRPYLESGDRETKQSSIDRHEVRIEKTMLRSYIETEGVDNKKKVKQRNVDFEPQIRNVGFDWTYNVNTVPYFYYPWNRHHTVGEPMWYGQYSQSLVEKSFKAYFQADIENDRNLSQQQGGYNYKGGRADAEIRTLNNVNSASDFNFTENGLTLTQGTQMWPENDNMSMDKDVLKTYYRFVPETGNDKCVFEAQFESGRVNTAGSVNLRNVDTCNRGKTHSNIGLAYGFSSDNENIENNFQMKEAGQHSFENINKITIPYSQNESDNNSNKANKKKIFQCTQCQKMFSRAKSLRRHITMIHEDPFYRPYKCSKCDSTFKCKYSLTSHMKTHERKPTFKYFCPECKTGFNNAEKLRLHMRTDKPDIKCESCNMTFKYKGCYKLHQKEHVEVEKCTTRQDVNHLTEAQSVHDDFKTTANSRPCHDDGVEREHITDTNKVSNTMSDLNTAWNAVNRIESDEVTQCESNTEKISEMIAESDNVMKADMTGGIMSLDSIDAVQPESYRENINENLHREPKRSVEEVSCGKLIDEVNKINTSNSFHRVAGEQRNEESENRLKAVTNKGDAKKLGETTTNSSGKMFNCSICEKTFSSKVSLNRHQVIHTGQKDYSCDICGKAFALKHTLKDHLRRHRGEKPYKCGQCGKAFPSTSGLATHKHSHSNHRPYKCEICSRTFKNKLTFSEHNKYAHVTDKAFKCGICEARFAWKGAYRYHLKIHTGDNEQPKLQCQICKKFYRGKASLNKHIKRVHEKTLAKPYHCGECGRSFHVKSHLKVHMEIHDRKPTLQYSCAHCNSAFKTSKYLRLHMNIHKTGICYKCDICNIAFKFHKSYIMHKSEHAA